MKRLAIVCILVAGALLLGASALRADDAQTPSVTDAFNKLSAALEKDPSISPETKKALEEFGEAVTKSQGQAAAAPGVQGKVADWFANEKNVKKFTDFFGGPDTKGLIDRITFNGDFRLRFESTTDAGSLKGDPRSRDEVRYRARLRIGAEYEIDPTIWVGARLVTGALNEQQSANQSFGDDFSKWQVSLDRAYVHWEPFAVAPMKVGDTTTYDPNIWAGKFGHPFKSTNLMWNSDVQPEGLAVINSFKHVGWLDEVQINGAAYVLTEDADQNDAWIGAGQVLAMKKFNVGLPDKLQLTWAESFYNVTDSTNDSDQSEILNNPNGNFKHPPTATAGGLMQSEYALIDSLFEVKYPSIQIGTKKMPLVGTFDFIYNASARPDLVNLDNHKQDIAYEVGAALGDPKKKGDWRIGADVVHAERDGVFKPITNDDWAVDNNFNGLDAYVDYAVANNAYFRVWALWDSPIDKLTTTGFSSTGVPNKFSNQLDHFRVRVEFNVKF